MKRKTRIPKKGKSDVSKLKSKLDQVFSEYIRRSRANKRGLCVCVTCGAKVHWKKLHNGHYIPRNHMATRFDERNVAPQCVGCNLFGKGKPDEYAIYLVDTYGVEILKELNQLKHTVSKWAHVDYEEKIQHYKDKLKELDGK